jgi:fructose-1,6-bisphosphatase class II
MRNNLKKLFNEDTSFLTTQLHHDLLSTTQAAAKACYDWIGMGNEKSADQAAVTAMRTSLNSLDIDGIVAIGEGERDEAPMLYIGESIGQGGSKIDIALDPLEGTTLCAHDAPNSISVIAATQRGGFLHAPDTYMEKIAVGANLPHDVVDLSNTVKKNLTNLARAKKCDISSLTVCILNRPRHDELIAKVRENGAKVKLIKDGDVMTAIATTLPSSNIDMYIGIGGAPEGVLAAAALKVLGGYMQGRLIFKDEKEKERSKIMGIHDFTKVYTIDEMAAGEIIFVATGITNGDYLNGVKQLSNGKFTYHSLIISSLNNSLSYNETCEL